MTTSPGRPALPSDDELEGRLRASWRRALARAEDDIAASNRVAGSSLAGRGRSGGRAAGAVLAAAAALLLVGIGVLAGVGATRHDAEPPNANLSTAAPAVGSPTPGPSRAPVETADSGIEVGATFPPTVDGQPVMEVGPEADARFLAATDDSPIAVAGWMLGSDRSSCGDFDLGSPAPDGVLFKDCTALTLRSTASGGDALRVYRTLDRTTDAVAVPGPAQAQRVLLVVHVHDVGCAAPDCARKPVIDRVVAYGGLRIAPAVLAASAPAGGLTFAQAVDAARASDPGRDGDGQPIVLLSAAAGPRAVVDDAASGSQLDWMWVVRFASADGFTTYTVLVGYQDGIVASSRSETNP